MLVYLRIMCSWTQIDQNWELHHLLALVLVQILTNESIQSKCSGWMVWNTSSEQFSFFFFVIFTPIPVGRTYSSIQWRHPTSLFPKKSLGFHFCLLFHSWRFVCHKNPWFWLKRKGLSRVFIKCWKLQGCIPTAHHSMGPFLGEAKNANVWICMVVLRDLPPKIMPDTLLFRMEIPTNDLREVTHHPQSPQATLRQYYTALDWQMRRIGFAPTKPRRVPLKRPTVAATTAQVYTV